MLQRCNGYLREAMKQINTVRDHIYNKHVRALVYLTVTALLCFIALVVRSDAHDMIRSICIVKFVMFMVAQLSNPVIDKYIISKLDVINHVLRKASDACFVGRVSVAGINYYEKRKSQ
jgi:hypothetical protein